MNLGQWMHKNSPTILTVIAAVGTGATAVLAAMATPDAIKSKEQAQQEKGEEKLTLWETVKAEAPAYIPAAAVGTGTIACIFGANILNQRQQASIASAYAVLNEMYGKYRKKVKDIFGEAGDRTVIQAIEEPMTATTINDTHTGKRNREKITAEIIYYWMTALEIPFECERWHLNRLLMLIRVSNIKNAPQKKMSKKDIYAQNKALNEARKRELGTRG